MDREVDELRKALDDVIAKKKGYMPFQTRSGRPGAIDVKTGRRYYGEAAAKRLAEKPANVKQNKKGGKFFDTHEGVKVVDEEGLLHSGRDAREHMTTGQKVGQGVKRVGQAAAGAAIGVGVAALLDYLGRDIMQTGITSEHEKKLRSEGMSDAQIEEARRKVDEAMGKRSGGDAGVPKPPMTGSHGKRDERMRADKLRDDLARWNEENMRKSLDDLDKKL